MISLGYGFLFCDPASQVIGGSGLNISTEVLMRTPLLHQPHLLWEPSSNSLGLLPSLGELEWLLIFRKGFGLRCFQPLSLTAWLPGYALSDNRYTRGRDTPFLSYWEHLPFMQPTHPAGRIRPVSRRTKPISDSPLIGEQPHPWALLRTQVGNGRRRNTNPPRRWGLSGETS